MKLLHKIICVVTIFVIIYLLSNKRAVNSIENLSMKLKRFPSNWNPKNIGASCECLAKRRKE